MCKLFADDTTLGDFDNDLDRLIKRFVEKLKVLLEWCYYNKLDINWSKTFFMFVTNRRVKLPKEITVDSKNINNKLIEIKVNVVTSFKLLGVTIDNKLTFTEHCSIIKKIVNWKMHSIKRLFYLCTSVKIQFFKTFILPYFDYCLSLIIYFPSTAYQSLCNCFNLCLFKLFNFKPEYDSEEDDEEKIMSDFLVKLQSYQLFTLQVRIYNKLLIFAHGIKTNARSPLELRSHLNSPVTPDIQTEENILPILGSYELRGRRVEKNVVPETKYETLTFKHFFPKLIKTFKVFDFSLKRDPFRLQVNLNLNENLKTFLTSFPKFDIKFSAFHRKKIKKQNQNQKETRKKKK